MKELYVENATFEDTLNHLKSIGFIEVDYLGNDKDVRLKLSKQYSENNDVSEYDWVKGIH